MSPEFGRILLVVGAVIVVIGLLTVMGIRLPFGNLPGDIRIGGERGGIFIPIATSIILSIVLTILLNVFIRR
jgi:hypothetical protein